MAHFPAALNPKEDDIAKMLACSVHIGTKNLDASMERYVWKRRTDGVFLINLQKTWEKLVLAARIIVSIENPQDVCAISARPYGQRAVLKYAHYTGAHPLAGRYTPGTFTNQIQDNFYEPRLLILTDPRTDHQPIRESSYVNIPTIAFCHTDSPLQHIDVAIPCNNKGKHSIGLMWYLLAREVMYLRNSISRASPWEVVVDLFLYRDPEEQEKDEQAVEAVQRGPIFENPEGTEWSAAPPQEWQEAQQQEWAASHPGASDWSADPQQQSWDNQDQ